MSQLTDHIAQLREDFMKGELSETSMAPWPSFQFENWMQEAVQSNISEVQAFHLCTVSKTSKPSSRIVYLREFFDNHFYFYTNYHSRKAVEMSHNQEVCMTFFWPELERQIRIEGTVSIAEKEKSDAYFEARPTESKIGAWSSPQSSEISSRDILNQWVQENSHRFKNQSIPRPDFWGGYVITANYYEFWQGRKSRLHDRISYTLENGEHWKIRRLAP